MSKKRIASLVPASLVLALFLLPAAVSQAAAGDTILVSRAAQADGAGADGDSGSNLAVSTGGLFVAFESSADNLSAEDDDAVQNVFVRDTMNNTTTLVSRVTGAGAGANGDSGNPAISSDGRYVAFESSADNLSTADNDTVENVFVRDMQSNTTTLVSRASGAGGVAAAADAGNPSISASGAVSFDSAADNLSPQDANGTRDVFLRDLSTNQTTLISRVSGPTGPGGDGNSYDPSVSDDGARVAFTSEADNLSTVDNDAVTNVFVYLVLNRFTVAVSQTPGRPGLAADAASFEPAISPDGGCVSFTSYAENLGGANPPTPAFTDVFVRDLQANTITFASRASGTSGAAGDGSSSNSSINHFLLSDGGFPKCDQRWVSYRSEADNLSGEDTATFDVFSHDMFYDYTALVSRASGAGGAAANGSSFGSAMSPEGGFVAFVSEADNLSGDDNDLFKNVYLRALAKFGQLYLQKGRWSGKELLPATWIEQATRAHIRQPAKSPQATSDWHQGYGYQFWRCRHGAFRGDGAFGQFCIVMPEHDAVVAITSRTAKLQGLLDLVWEHLLPGSSADASAAEAAADAQLRSTLASLALPLPVGSPTPRLPGEWPAVASCWSRTAWVRRAQRSSSAIVLVCSV